MKLFVGLGKTQFTSTVCDIHYDKNSNRKSVQIRSTERLTRKKSSGAWPMAALENFVEETHIGEIKMGENRDVQHPQLYEQTMNRFFPLIDSVRSKGLGRFLSESAEVEYVSHHLAHAYTAMAMSPYERCFIVVIDGAGSLHTHVVGEKPLEQRGYVEGKENVEQYSVYKMEHGTLTPLLKKWQHFENLAENKISISDSIGIFYETIASYIFNSKTAAGKVMGLADFSEPLIIKDRIDFLKSLDWSKAFKGKGKSEWEADKNMDYFKQLAATAQHEYEKHVSGLLNEIKKYDETIDSLIMVGGSALNCTHNTKIITEKIFKNVYVPPFPGDEGISFGVAHYLLYRDYPQAWNVCPAENQISYWGSHRSIPQDDEIEEKFSGRYNIKKINEEYEDVVELLANNKIVAWYQDRSECGPRALGNRSIIARVDKTDLKNYLNSSIKFREEFRPYGCTCLYEKMSEYFETPECFDNSFMSFSLRVKPKHYEIFKEVTHIDKTSRMQSIKKEQNKKFYKLIEAYGDKYGIYALLNTSLNVMGEPIVETCADMFQFMEKTPVDAAVIGKYLIVRK